MAGHSSNPNTISQSSATVHQTHKKKGKINEKTPNKFQGLYSTCSRAGSSCGPSTKSHEQMRSVPADREAIVIGQDLTYKKPECKFYTNPDARTGWVTFNKRTNPAMKKEELARIPTQREYLARSSGELRESMPLAPTYKKHMPETWKLPDDMQKLFDMGEFSNPTKENVMSADWQQKRYTYLINQASLAQDALRRQTWKVYKLNEYRETTDHMHKIWQQLCEVSHLEQQESMDQAIASDKLWKELKERVCVMEEKQKQATLLYSAAKREEYGPAKLQKLVEQMEKILEEDSILTKAEHVKLSKDAYKALQESKEHTMYAKLKEELDLVLIDLRGHLSNNKPSQLVQKVAQELKELHKKSLTLPLHEFANDQAFATGYNSGLNKGVALRRQNNKKTATEADAIFWEGFKTAENALGLQMAAINGPMSLLDARQANQTIGYHRSTAFHERLWIDQTHNTLGEWATDQMYQDHLQNAREYVQLFRDLHSANARMPGHDFRKRTTLEFMAHPKDRRDNPALPEEKNDPYFDVLNDTLLVAEATSRCQSHRNEVDSMFLSDEHRFIVKKGRKGELDYARMSDWKLPPVQKQQTNEMPQGQKPTPALGIAPRNSPLYSPF